MSVYINICTAQKCTENSGCLQLVKVWIVFFFDRMWYSLKKYFNSFLRSQAIQPYKVYNSVGLSVSRQQCNHYHNFRTLSSPQKEALYPLTDTSHLSPVLPLSCFRQLLHYLSVWAFHINESIQHVVSVSGFFHFGIMFSRFIYSSACDSASPFITE